MRKQQEGTMMPLKDSSNLYTVVFGKDAGGRQNSLIISQKLSVSSLFESYFTVSQKLSVSSLCESYFTVFDLYQIYFASFLQLKLRWKVNLI